MAKQFKSKNEIMSLATALRERRLLLGLTLKNIEESLNINCGQLSRFEAGQFKTNSHNMQKLCTFLHINHHTSELHEGALGLRLERFAALSPQHRAAAEEILRALERLD